MNSKPPVDIVWFKRDLRVVDHEAFVRAAHHGTVLLLVVIEPELWAQPDMSSRHYQFYRRAVMSLQSELVKLGAELVIRVGDVVDILEDLSSSFDIQSIWSHQETWTWWTYDRDKRVFAWCRANHVDWVEPRQFGVVRRLKDRDGWAGLWQHLMQQPCFSVPDAIRSVSSASDPIPDFPHLPNPVSETYLGEVSLYAARSCLASFLRDRGEFYTTEMSSPVTAFESCSRLSVYLSFGVISLREVYQTAVQRSQEIRCLPRGEKGGWSKAMRSFLGRLRWHCHFIQKLEDEPEIEFRTMHPMYSGLRPSASSEEKRVMFEAWKQGKTGYPFVDACMRALIETGWLNFRMRAMVMSFASYHLWLDWREPAHYLARLFTDYEPGIHYAQVQMQSGTTGMNSIRIYNPIKQSRDQDPEGEFIRRWVPELCDVDLLYVHEPWLSPHLIEGYPLPVVDEKGARKEAARIIFECRKQEGHRDVSKALVTKHGSRRKVRSRKRPVPKSDGQVPLF